MIRPRGWRLLVTLWALQLRAAACTGEQEVVAGVAAEFGGEGWLEAPDRSAGINVIGVGFARSGTQTYEAVMQQMGFRICFHSPCPGVKITFEGSNSTTPWVWWRARLDLSGGERAPETLLEQGVDATAPHEPHMWIWEDLYDRYPKSKVVLLHHPRRRTGYLESREKAELLRVRGLEHGLAQQYCKNNFFPRVPFDDETKHYIESAYDEVIERVRLVVEPSRLLEWSVTDPLERLAQFVGRPTPSGTGVAPRLDALRSCHKLLEFAGNCCHFWRKLKCVVLQHYLGTHCPVVELKNVLGPKAYERLNNLRDMLFGKPTAVS